MKPRSFSYFGRLPVTDRPARSGAAEPLRKGPAQRHDTPAAGGPPPPEAAGVSSDFCALTLVTSRATLLTLRLAAAEAGISESALVARLVARHAEAVGIARLADAAEGEGRP